MNRRAYSEWEPRSLASLGTYLNGFAFKPQHWGEYGLPIGYEVSRFTLCRWISSEDPKKLDAFIERNLA